MNIGFYKLILATIGPLYRFAFPGRVFGAENIPEEGGVVICANHQHFLDCVFLLAENQIGKGNRAHALSAGTPSLPRPRR